MDDIINFITKNSLPDNIKNFILSNKLVIEKNQKIYLNYSTFFCSETESKTTLILLN